MNACTDRPVTTPRTTVIGLVAVVLLASLLFGLRGMVMFPAEPVPVEHHPPVHGDSSPGHDHLSHCPLCFLLMLLPSLAPEPGVAHVLSFALQIWLGERRARDAFLKGMAARGPPLQMAVMTVWEGSLS
ncbi:DUF2946 domain-containing protein [Meiothermus sp. CFH 77666]|uniref:DUF2946 domain-containing protein n=1 Tax=Meiothermus sp. CFH 77666 TaxID=2817942 RepID=UPI001AA02371|nr:DUF2946 domain-containing protein [Meiothermus sp. CFH 77666]MBO1435657.1 DUF2946 domain-containing protein [Meiothermus sp. CFH 77666]